MVRAASGASKAADDLLALSPGAASSGGDSGNAEEIQNNSDCGDHLEADGTPAGLRLYRALELPVNLL
jgi:hypothetical protein